MSKEFKNKNVFIDSHTYIVAKASGLNIVTEHETVVFLNDIPDFDMSRLKNAINNNVYDLFFLKIENPCSYKNRKICNFEQSFINYSNKNLPIHLKGRLILSKK